MKYKVILHKQAQKELNKLELTYSKEADSDYRNIQEKGIEHVTIKPVRQGLYEIKSKSVRSLFIFKDNKIILIGVVFLKKSNKIPDRYIETALNRLKGANNE